MIDIILVSFDASIAIALTLILTPFLGKRFSVKWRYFAWIIIAVRMLIPFRPEFSEAPVQISYDEKFTIKYQRNSVMDNEQPTVNPDGTSKNNSNKNGSLPIKRWYTVIDVKSAANALILFGAIVFFLAHIIAYARFRLKIKPHCERIRDEIYCCESVESPMLIGFFKPIILIPNKDYTKEEIEIIILHEMTHFRRQDMWYKLIILAANSLHWFNPLAYAMTRLASRDIEYLCDDALTRSRSADFRKEYSLVILKTIGDKDNGKIH